MEFLVVVKRDCETCQMVGPVLADLKATLPVTIYSQDDPGFPEQTGGARDDRGLEESWRRNIEVVPTVIRIEDGDEVERTQGWDRAEWRRITGHNGLGAGLPDFRPGCGSRSVEPGMPELLSLQLGGMHLISRKIEVNEMDDPMEVAHDRGWTDGLPIVPPTDLRIARMLSGTTRKSNETIGLIPPNLAECTIEKVAISAVMAGCRPEYMPVVLAVVEAALKPEFSMHGLLATLGFAGPVVIVNGPVTKRIGMNSKGNALGQGNRANASIGRTLQLLIRNMGGGIPQEIDRSILGNPGKYTFCFAEDEDDEDWMPLNVSRGSVHGSSTVTLFHGDGVQGCVAWHSRTPEEVSRSLAMALLSVCHPKSCQWSKALLVLCPDHYKIYQQNGWGRPEIQTALWEALKRPGKDLIRGAHGVPEGIEPSRADEIVDKFHEEDGLLIVRAGGKGAGQSAIIGGWPAQRKVEEIKIVSKEVGT
tara:strand:- start:51577 stop:53004 length:1428 start_codon:yes stop_codon:yes gene_type:complete